MKQLQVPPNQTPLSNTMRMPFGISEGITLSESTIALMVMRQLYLRRFDVIEKLILTGSPASFSDALELAQSLALLEKLLIRNGVSTEREALDQAGKFEEKTSIEKLVEAFADDSSANDFTADVNRIFRPWLLKKAA